MFAGAADGRADDGNGPECAAGAVAGAAVGTEGGAHHRADVARHGGGGGAVHPRRHPREGATATSICSMTPLNIPSLIPIVRPNKSRVLRCAIP